jgi:hypothetical protein
MKNKITKIIYSIVMYSHIKANNYSLFITNTLGAAKSFYILIPKFLNIPSLY